MPRTKKGRYIKLPVSIEAKPSTETETANSMTSVEISFLLWGCGILLSILAFVGITAANQLIKMAKDLNEIKVIIGKIDTKHDELEKRVHRLEKQLA